VDGTCSHASCSATESGSKNAAGTSNRGRPGSGPIGRGSVRPGSSARSSATGLLWRQTMIRSPRAARSRYSDSRALISNTLTLVMTIFLTSSIIRASRNPVDALRGE
jgi:hypothetical protein